MTLSPTNSMPSSKATHKESWAKSEAVITTENTGKLLEIATAKALRYLQGLETRSVAPTVEAVANIIQFDESLPNDPTNPDQVLQMLDDIGSPASMATAGSRYFGFVIGGSLPVALAANWLAGAWDQPTGIYNITPATALIEQVALDWLLELLQLPAECGVGFVTGATMANFTALAAARHTVLAQVGWDVEANGLFGAPPISVVMGEEAHPTVFKSLGLLGLGRSQVIRVPADEQGRLRPEAIPSLTGPVIIIAQAGNVNTGAFDPLAAICARAREMGAWVHVDGAFGLWAAATETHAYLTHGLEQADSWATDAHKTLNVPYDSGLAFVRHADALRAAMAITAEYLPTAGEMRNPSDYTPELSRRARGIEIWAALRSLGRSGLATMIERMCHHARRFAIGLEAAGFQILNDVVFNQVWSPLVMRQQPNGLSKRSKRTAQLGAAALFGKGKRPCASASPPGSPPRKMWSAAWQQW